MRWALSSVLVVACGGSSSPPKEPVEPAPQKITRVPVETAEEEQEDGVTFVKTKGTMSKEAIEAGLAPHQEAMMECYTAKVGKRKWLGGEVRLFWEIKADGSIKTVKIDSNLGAWDVENCLLDIAWSAQFDRPKGGEAEFDVPLQFSATRSTAIWDEDQALRAVGGQLAKLDECPNGPEPEKKPAKKGAKKAPKPKVAKAPKGDEAEKAERPEPRPPSNVTVTLYVGPQGKAQSIGFSSPTSEIGPKWATCADQVANAWRLPDPKGQIAKLAIRYKPE